MTAVAVGERWSLYGPDLDYAMTEPNLVRRRLRQERAFRQRPGHARGGAPQRQVGASRLVRSCHAAHLDRYADR